jgi:hypothetical protein
MAASRYQLPRCALCLQTPAGYGLQGLGRQNEGRQWARALDGRRNIPSLQPPLLVPNVTNRGGDPDNPMQALVAHWPLQGLGQLEVVGGAPGVGQFSA